MTKFESAADKEQQQASQQTLHKTNKNRPDVFQKYKFQCISLTRKNSVLIVRNKLFDCNAPCSNNMSFHFWNDRD